MARRSKRRFRSRSKPASIPFQQSSPQKPWGRRTRELPGYVMDSLNKVFHYLGNRTRKRLGLMMEIPVFIMNPLLALENPQSGVREIAVRLEEGMGDGPTSSRLKVVDFNGDTQTLTDPVVWNADHGWFHLPIGRSSGYSGESQEIEWLPDTLPKFSKNEQFSTDFIERTARNFYYHHVNVWAIAQMMIDYFEGPYALGRSISWGFDGSRLIIHPHAGYGSLAFYNRQSGSLEFFYLDDLDNPLYPCLSFEIIVHEMTYAILDGIRPFYYEFNSIQTLAFLEFICDQTAIMLAMLNPDILQFFSRTTIGQLDDAGVFASIAPEFGEEIKERPYLRSAVNTMRMEDVQGSLSPHDFSQVLIGAMFDILIGIASKHLEKNIPGEIEGSDSKEGIQSGPFRKVTPAQALWWSIDRFSRMVMQPLDLCPPCDVQILDYAKAMFRNDVLVNPLDEQDIRQIMLDVFHQRGLCQCTYESGGKLQEECQFNEDWKLQLNFLFRDFKHVPSSLTAAYYFLSDNRELLNIPKHQDIQVVDLYENNKLGIGKERLSRQIVLEYLWQEEILLQDDLENGLYFGNWNGKSHNMNCGGTLVFDDRGNLLSWYHKPGTEHITPDEEKDILERKVAWEGDRDQASQSKIRKPSRLEENKLADKEEGMQRKASLLKQLSSLIQLGMVDVPHPDKHISEVEKPIVAIEENDVVRFEILPHLRQSGFDVGDMG